MLKYYLELIGSKLPGQKATNVYVCENCKAQYYNVHAFVMHATHPGNEPCLAHLNSKLDSV